MTPQDLRGLAQIVKFACDNAMILRLNLADISAFSALGVKALQEADAVETKQVEEAKK